MKIVVARYVADSTASAKTANAAIRHLRRMRANDGNRSDEDRQHETTGNGRADPRSVRPRGRPVRGEPDVDPFISAADAPRMLDHPGDEQSHAGRQCRDHEQTCDQRDQEGDNCMATERSAQALGGAARPCTKNGHAAGFGRVSRRMSAGKAHNWWLGFGECDGGICPVLDSSILSTNLQTPCHFFCSLSSH